METSFSTTAIRMIMDRTQLLMQVALIRRQQEMDMAVAETVSEAAQAAPAPEGTGPKVDKLA